ncbi:CPBP family intramembrane glutamic endopeptidase [Anaerosacchariphilus polymeriproducens]|uniref:CPBP family intramembrane metalloprotease n=1 Tax=Anaerosacchariphilus polymeriproducens TaxID=1812858 RepID=A0A371AT97_9FIRM|nr:type II CAAX endopeptidase family protein [Anaerosacchariphilus polymeriproducens]RDU22690.1 CPBP family intramembrane metalloprotease [Anaerosacchariphilus polymeriproducens]
MRTTKNAGILFLIITIVYILGIFTIFKLNMNGIQLSTYLLLLVSQGFIVIPGLIFLLVTKSNPIRLIPYRKIKISNLLLVVLITYLMIPLMSTISMISQFFVKDVASKAIGSLMDGPFLLNFLFIAVSPAIFEEFIFRGIMFHTMRKASIKYAALISSIMFGLVHLNFNQFCYTVFMGVFFALLIEATGSIYSSMTAHLIINGNSVILLTVINLIIKKANELGLSTDLFSKQSGQSLQFHDGLSTIQILISVGVWILISIGTAVLAGVVFIVLCKRCNRWEHVKSIWKEEKKEKIVTFPLIFGVCICILFMFFREFII